MSAASQRRDFNGPSTGEFAGAAGVSDADAAKGALNVAPGEFAEGSRDYSAPRAAPYSSQGVIEEVVVRAQYTGTRLPPLTYYINPTITAQQYVDRQMNALNRRLGTVVEYGSYAVGSGAVYQGGRVLLRNQAVREFAWEMGGNILGEIIDMPSGTGLPKYDPNKLHSPPAIVRYLR